MVNISRCFGLFSTFNSVGLMQVFGLSLKMFRACEKKSVVWISHVMSNSLVFSTLNVGLVSLPPSGCGGTLTTSSGIFMSPNYPMPYYHSSECYWLLRGSRGTPFEIQFEQFHLEYHPNCNFDYLAVCIPWSFALQEAAKYDECKGKKKHLVLFIKCSYVNIPRIGSGVSVGAQEKEEHLCLDRPLKWECVCIY